MWRFATALSFLFTAAQAQTPDWAQIGTIFTNRCIICHSGDAAPLGLQLDSYENALAGGWMGAVLLAGNPDDSRLIGRLSGSILPRMPLNGPPYLTDAEISLVVAWIEAGMPRGDADPVSAPAARPRPAPGAPIVFADVAPIFLQRCAKCHSRNSIFGVAPEGLLLESYETVLAGGERLAVLPGNPEMSEIWRRLVGLGQPRMPFDGPPWLDAADIALVYDWIAQGAADDSGIRASIPFGRTVRLRGRMTGRAEIDGAAFRIGPTTRIDDWPDMGVEAEMRGAVMPDGSVRATRLRSR